MFKRFIQGVKNILYECRARIAPLQVKVHHTVPFVCQFSIPSHAELSLLKHIEPKNDPYWKETGATSSQRYARWAFTMCGMACTCMALAHYKKGFYLPAELAEDALKHGVYVEDENDISSMRYAPFALWVGKLGLEARVASRLSITRIQHALGNGKLVIASVNPNIRGYQTALPEQKGGHLILVVGYDTLTNTIFIHNPSGFESTHTQRDHAISITEFKKYFAGRGIILQS